MKKILLIKIAKKIIIVLSVFFTCCSLNDLFIADLVVSNPVENQLDSEEESDSEINSSAEQEEIDLEDEIDLEEEQTDQKDVEPDSDSNDSEVIEKELEEIDAPDFEENENREWSILIYMAADNNLEASAIDDICEMEMSKLNTNNVSVLMLLDRSPLYDSSNGNWTSTKMYRLKTGSSGRQRRIISEEIPCNLLGLPTDSNVELDMASDYVLTNAMDFLYKAYPAENYGLIMWGHGTGWRCEELEQRSAFNKGFAYDNTSGLYMTLKQLGNSLLDCLQGKRLNFLGFDTCFGGEFEVFYELKSCAEYVVASEGLVSSSGWDYELLFNDFAAKDSKTPVELCHSAIKQFENSYVNKREASIVAVNLNETEKMNERFEVFMKNTVEKLDKCEKSGKFPNIYSDLIKKIGSDCIKFSYGNPGSDVYLDLENLAFTINSFYEEQNLRDFIVENPFMKKNMTFVVDSWSSELNISGVGIYFSTLSEGNIFSAKHPNGYIKGKIVNQINFVNENTWYVPSNDKNGSFLDKLFYGKN